MKIFDTNRLVLRQVNINDAKFIFNLLNEPSWIQYIGNKNIKTLDDAKDYIRNGPIAMYAQYGFGLLVAELKSDQAPIGLCGLIKRDDLEDVDLGFAFLPEYWGKDYAMESASATIMYGKATHKLSRLVAITLTENYSSVNLLKKLGFRFENTMYLEGDDEELELYSMNI